MNRQGILSQGARVTIAVVALYGLLLQAFLTGMLPANPTMAHGLSELCAPGSDAGGTPAKHEPHGCCTAACAPVAVPPPSPLATLVPWPSRDAVVVAFQPADAILSTGPPLDDHPPRGPPTA